MVKEICGVHVCGTVHLSFLHRIIIPEVWATREEVQQMNTLLAASDAWFNGLRCGSRNSCTDRVWRTFLRRRGSLAAESVMYVSCTPVVSTCSDRVWRNFLRRRGLLAAESVMYVSGTPVGASRRYRTVSLGGWFVLQLHLQRVRTKERCLGV
jgi:hypothetical protein